ncbi:hypothetical protein MASR2M70_13090 [Bacillota bacterium]
MSVKSVKASPAEEIIDFCVIFEFWAVLAHHWIGSPPSFRRNWAIDRIEATPVIQIGIIVVIAVVYTTMAYVGIDKA